MGDSISDSTKIAAAEKAYTPFPIRMSIWAAGSKISSQLMDSTFTHLGKSTKESSWMVRNMVEALTNTKVEQSTTDNGTKTVKMGMAFILTPMERNTKATGSTGRSTARETTIIRMGTNTSATGSRTKRMGMECCNI